MQRPWSDVRSRYVEDVPGLELRWMKALVEHPVESGKSTHLFGFTSMFDLIISQSPPTHPQPFPHLRISPKVDGSSEFRYVDSLRPEDQWHRTAPGSDGILRLERFFEQLRGLVGKHPD